MEVNEESVQNNEEVDAAVIQESGIASSDEESAAVPDASGKKKEKTFFNQQQIYENEKVRDTKENQYRYGDEDVTAFNEKMQDDYDKKLSKKAKGDGQDVDFISEAQQSGR